MRGALAFLALGCWSQPGVAAPEAERAKGAESLTVEAINKAAFATPEKKASAKTSAGKTPQPLLMKVQVLLDRAHFSPGAIDGRDGENLRGALSAFAVAQGLAATKTVTPELFDKLQATSPDPVAVSYTITEADVAGPFVDPMPAKMEDQAALEAMGYTTIREMLAERFHMARDLVTALNPDAALDKAGTVITVAGVSPLEMGKPKADSKPDKAAAKDGKKADRKADAAADEPGKDERKSEPSKNEPSKDVARIEVDKRTKQVRAFDKSGTLRAFYPASIGSEEKPAPSGDATVKGVAFDPWYTYNPKYRFMGVGATEKFSIHPGPNNPVGLVWIDLSIPSYGIHGTPEPEKVGKTESHGCIRLTNWDARDLAQRVERGAKVEFKDE